MAELMTPKHPKWDEFIERLAGIEGCDFSEDENGDPRWYCSGGKDKPEATKILRKMNAKIDDEWMINVEGSLEYFDEHGGHCDCEIIWNVKPDPEIS